MLTKKKKNLKQTFIITSFAEIKFMDSKIIDKFLSDQLIIIDKLKNIHAEIDMFQPKLNTKNLLDYEYLVRDFDFYIKVISIKLDDFLYRFKRLNQGVLQLLNLNSQETTGYVNYYSTILRMIQDFEFNQIQIDNIFDVQINNPYEIALYQYQNSKLKYLEGMQWKNDDFLFNLNQKIQVFENQEIEFVIMMFGDVKVRLKEKQNQYSPLFNAKSPNNFIQDLRLSQIERKCVEIIRLKDKEMNFLNTQDSVKLSVNQPNVLTIRVLKDFHLSSIYHPVIQKEKPVGLAFAWQQSKQKLIFRIYKGLDINSELLFQTQFEVDNQANEPIEVQIDRIKDSYVDGVKLKQGEIYTLSIEQLNMACYYYSYQNEQPNIYFQTVDQQNQLLKSHNKKGIFPKFKIAV